MRHGLLLPNCNNRPKPAHAPITQYTAFGFQLGGAASPLAPLWSDSSPPELKIATPCIGAAERF
jgi:hypothetical protein